MEQRLSITQAALRLGLTYHQVRAQLLTGELRGGEDDRGRFYVTVPARDGTDAQQAEKP